MVWVASSDYVVSISFLNNIPIDSRHGPFKNIWDAKTKIASGRYNTYSYQQYVCINSVFLLNMQVILNITV